MRLAIACSLVATACGRIGFDETTSSNDDATPMHPWELVGVAEIESGNTIALSTTNTAVLVVVAVNLTDPESVTSISADAPGTFTAIPTARCVNGNSGPMELWYATNVVGARRR